MYKFNHLLKAKEEAFVIKENLALDVLASNDNFEEIKSSFFKTYNKKSLKTISFTKEGILSLLLNLKGKIAVSLGESEAIVQGARLFKTLGFEIDFLSLNKEGQVEFIDKNYDYIFISSYIMDTFVKTSLKDIKNKTKAKLISNGSADLSSLSDILIFDTYKLSSYTSSAVVLFNDELEESPLANIDSLVVFLTKNALNKQKFNYEIKKQFQESLEEIFKEELYYFVKPSSTLDYSLHIGLKNIKARELIRSLSLSDIYITNGEGCALGLSKPSRIIQEMSYEESISRNSISLSFVEEISKEEIKNITKEFYKKYKQIRLLNEQ